MDQSPHQPPPVHAAASDGGCPTGAEYLQGLRRRLIALLPEHGDFATALPGVRLSRIVTTDTGHARTGRTSLYFVLQGELEVVYGAQRRMYRELEYLAIHADLPMSTIVHPSGPDQPFLGIYLEVDAVELSTILAELPAETVQRSITRPGLKADNLSRQTADALQRLLGLLDEPNDIGFIAPLIRREILYRVLQGNQASQLARMAIGAASTRKVAAIVRKLKTNIDTKFNVQRLADEMSMSVSSLHHQFKAATGLSPIRYQKLQRLHAARHILLQGEAGVTGASLMVGYSNCSQFGREYAALFGTSPMRDVRRLRSLLTEATNDRQSGSASPPRARPKRRAPN